MKMPDKVLMHSHLDLCKLAQPDGYCVLAKDSIPSGATLMLVPRSHTLRIDTTMDSELKAWPPVYVAAMHLMLELHHAAKAVKAPAAPGKGRQGGGAGTVSNGQHGEDTFRSHAGVLCDVLSAGIGNVPSWGSEQQSALVGTSLEHARTTLPLTERFKAKVAPYMRARPKKYPADCVDEGSFVACIALIMSRCFGASASSSGDGAGEGPPPPSGILTPTTLPVLVPGADYFNHAYAEEEVSARVSFDPSTGDAIVTSVRPVSVPPAPASTRVSKGKAKTGSKGGESSRSKPLQVYSTYGQLSDARLLYGYGFVVPPHGPGMESGRVEDIRWNVHNTVLVRGVDVVDGILQAGAKDSTSKAQSVLKSTLEDLQAVGLWPQEGGGPHGAGAVALGHQALAAAEQAVRARQAQPRTGKKRPRPSETVDLPPLVPVELSTAVQVLVWASQAQAVQSKGKGKAHSKDNEDRGYITKYLDMLRQAANAARSGQDVSSLSAELCLDPVTLPSDDASGSAGIGSSRAGPGPSSSLLMSLARVLRACLKRYPTSIDEDIEDALEEAEEAGSSSVPMSEAVAADHASGRPPLPVWPLRLPPAGKHVTRCCRLVALGEKLLLQRYMQTLADLAAAGC